MIRPLTNQVLLRMLPPSKLSDGGLFLPEIATDNVNGERKKPVYALVAAVGPWRKTRGGLSVLPDFQPGDKVLVSQYAGTKLARDISEGMTICRVEDVLAVVKIDETTSLR